MLCQWILCIHSINQISSTLFCLYHCFCTAFGHEEKVGSDVPNESLQPAALLFKNRLAGVPFQPRAFAVYMSLRISLHKWQFHSQKPQCLALLLWCCSTPSIPWSKQVVLIVQSWSLTCPSFVGRRTPAFCKALPGFALEGVLQAKQFLFIGQFEQWLNLFYTSNTVTPRNHRTSNTYNLYLPILSLPLSWSSAYIKLI